MRSWTNEDQTQKQKDLEALTEQFKNAKAAMWSDQGHDRPKDQELRNQMREAGVIYGVVRTLWLARRCEGTALAQAADQFKAHCRALSNEDPVSLSKGKCEVYEANPDIFKFKVGDSRRHRLLSCAMLKLLPACLRRKSGFRKCYS